LLGIWALLQITDTQSTKLASSRLSTRVNWIWGFFAGATVGWSFLIKGFMIFVPIIALSPYIISNQRYRKLITNPGIYIGLIIGMIPTGLWLILSCYKYGGIMPVRDLLDKVLFLSQTDIYNPGPFYYFWNIPANIFPWALFSAIGAVVVCYRLLSNINYSTISLTLGYPVSLFILLSLFRTRTPYYPMQFFPFMALLAGAAFGYFTQVSRHQSIWWYRLVTWISYAFSGLGVLLGIAGFLVITNSQLWGIIITSEIRVYALPVAVLGCGWTTIIVLWRRWQPPHIPYWLASWLVPAWFTIIIFGLEGAWVDKSPDFKASFYQLVNESTVGSQPINLLTETAENNSSSQVTHQEKVLSGEELKSLILLTFYTPHLGKKILDFKDLPEKSYAWALSIPAKSAPQVRTIGTFQNWKLIQKMSNRQ
jgi:4-amino-4-deoxy-L-arabinose transferase-like glycosyltransferase